MKLILAILVLTTTAFGNDIEKRLPAFKFKDAMAVFTDFTDATYQITYDITQKQAYGTAEIKFTNLEEGYPVFDLHADPTTISLDGVATQSVLTTTPNNETSVRVVQTKIQPGSHIMKLTFPINQLVEFTDTAVKSAFWQSDLTDRGYLERYLPTNFIYDRIPTTFFVKFMGAKEKQNIYTNGVTQEIGTNETKITFPENWNPTCLYFHTTPASSIAETRFNYKSVDGRELPIVIYVPNEGTQPDQLSNIKAKTISLLEELEGDYGAFLHPSLTIYVVGPSGGMEYSGATMTSFGALSHELFHSYYARGVMPSHGNSGWIDEALARWRDNGYQTISTLSGTSQMANHPTYTRATDRLAYTFGERFFALMDGKVKEKGGLKPFLRATVENHAFNPLSVSDFISYMEQFYGVSFSADFKKYVFGKSKSIFKSTMNPVSLDQSMHRQFSLSELKNLL